MAERGAALEVRTVKAEFEVRNATSSAPTIEGFAATFDQPYDLGTFMEVVDRGAFRRTLGTKPDVRFLVDHQGQPLARTKSGTLELDDKDPRGLHMRAKDLDMSDPDVQRLIPKVRRGDLDEMSFAFRVPAGGDEWDEGFTKRTLRNVELNGGDVSIVTYPANPNTAGLSVRADDVRAAHGVLLERMVREIRAGNTVDMDRLKHVLELIAAADTAVDQAQPILADVLGVPNPDADDEMMEGERSASQPYGDVTYADPGYQSDGKKRYPLDTEAHVRAAWSYINQESNASAYSAEQLSSIKSRIKSAAKKFGIEIDSGSNSGGLPLSLAIAQATRLGLR